MNKIKEIIRYLRASVKNYLPDKWILKREYRLRFHTELNFRNPQTFNEKLNWLKLYNRNPLYTTLVDKYTVKKWVADKIGEQHVVPTLGVWENFDDIDFNKLPNQFVLKCTHDSGGLIIVKSKDDLDRNVAKSKINKSLKKNFYHQSREWPYKNVPPRIIAEKYMEDKLDGELRDYKFYTFNGIPKFMLIVSNRNIPEKKGFDYFDMNGIHQNLQDVEVHNSPIGIPHLPNNFEKMKEFCIVLAKNIPHVRIDFFEVNGQIYFGEMTFFDAGGFMKATPKSWELEWGKLIKLPGKE